MKYFDFYNFIKCCVATILFALTLVLVSGAVYLIRTILF